MKGGSRAGAVNVRCLAPYHHAAPEQHDNHATVITLSKLDISFLDSELLLFDPLFLCPILRIAVRVSRMRPRPLTQTLLVVRCLLSRCAVSLSCCPAVLLSRCLAISMSPQHYHLMVSGNQREPAPAACHLSRLYLTQHTSRPPVRCCRVRRRRPPLARWSLLVRRCARSLC